MEKKKRGAQIYGDIHFTLKHFSLETQRAEPPADNLATATSKEVAALYLCNNNILISAVWPFSHASCVPEAL